MTAITQPGRAAADASTILSEEALEFVRDLHREFDATRQALLGRRRERRRILASGHKPDFPETTRGVRESDAWRVAPCPDDLLDRRVEITGPVERKMMINALNSGANVFMADFEDALSPTWANVTEGQRNVRDAARGELRLRDEAKGKSYEVGDDPATLVVRPRGWHLDEKHVWVKDRPISASLFDAGLYLFHNARTLVENGSGPYFYLPKLESHLEARLWNSVFEYAQDALGLPRGTIRATVLIETICAAFEMDEILYELKDHASGLNAGRWDYIFSVIKVFNGHSDKVLPDRAAVTMAVPFMRAYADLLVRTCHRRGAHAIGGMAAFIPNRRDPEVTERALAKVAEDKRREAGQGFDGTWIAHPDLTETAKRELDAALGSNPHQKHRLREEVQVCADDLVDTRIEGASLSEAGMRTNVSVALQYMSAWLGGRGAVAINDLMEDAATAEISRAQLWQWLHHAAALEDGRKATRELYEGIRDEEAARLNGPHLEDAVVLLDDLVTAPRFEDFLTTGAYERLP